MSLDDFVDDRELEDTIKRQQIAIWLKFKWYVCKVGNTTFTIPDQTPAISNELKYKYPAMDGIDMMGKPFHFSEQTFSDRDIGDWGFAYGFSIAELKEKAHAECRPLQPTDKVKAYPAAFFGDWQAISKFTKTMTYGEALNDQKKQWILEPFATN